MEEKKENIQKKADAQKNNKLSYEQLEAYANQSVMQMQKLINENQQMRQALTDMQRNLSIKEIELALKCIELSDKFSPNFIESIRCKIEDVLTPQATEVSEEPKTEESK